MGLVLITAATTYPVTLAQARAQTKGDAGQGDDDHVNALIAAATAYVEDYTGRSFMTQTWELVLDAFSDAIQLPKGPVQSVTSLKYDDTAGVEQTVDPGDYTFDSVSDPQWLVRDTDATWPTTLDAVNVVRVRYVAGYTAVPAAITMAIKFLISQWYDNRTPFSEGSPVEIPNTVAALLCNHRAFGF